jgi:hypothetical protein
LSKFGRFFWIYSGPQIGLLEEITPTRPSVFLALTPIEIIDGSLCGLSSPDDGHNSSRLVRSLVKPNDCE